MAGREDMEDCAGTEGKRNGAADVRGESRKENRERRVEVPRGSENSRAYSVCLFGEHHGRLLTCYINTADFTFN